MVLISNQVRKRGRDMLLTLAMTETRAVSGWIASGILLLVVIGLIITRPRSSEPRSSEPPASQPRRFTISAWLIIGVFFAAFILVGAALEFGRGTNGLAIAIPLLLVAGVLILVDAVAVLVVIFMRHGLANRDYALALPDGSIRAIIALALIVMFAVLAVYLYSAAPVSNTAQADLAKQLVTTLSTLIVALASFYFGSSTTASAHEKAKSQEPRAPDIATVLDAANPIPGTPRDASKDTPKEASRDLPKETLRTRLKGLLTSK
jgi:hypothetical protein